MEAKQPAGKFRCSPSRRKSSHHVRVCVAHGTRGAMPFFFAVVLLGGSTRRKGAKTRVDIAVPSVGCVRRAILSDAIHSQRQDSSQKRRVRRARSPAVCCTTQAGIPPGSNPIAKGCLLREVSLSQPRADNIDAGPCSSSACLSRTGYGAIGAHGDGVCTW